MRNLPANRVPEAWAGVRETQPRPPVIALARELTTHEMVERSLAALQRARTRERRLRVALSAWSAVLLSWLVPVTPWSPAHLPPNVTIVVAVLFSAIMGVVVWLHRQASDPERLRIESNPVIPLPIVAERRA